MPLASDTSEPTAEQDAYLSQKLQEVSRSFALVVPCLELPLRHHLATAYLLCRVVDNIEDSGQTDEWRTKRFGEFCHLVHEPYRAEEVLSAWERESWPALTADERRMMGVADGLALWTIFAELPPATQATIRQWTRVMAEGMKQLSDSAHHASLIHRDGCQVLISAADYNRYCYYVAGTVGHLTTELVILQYGFSAELGASLRARAEACGRALQKTNFVKDFAGDLRRGICYLPDEWLKQVDYMPLRLQGAPRTWTAMVLQDVLAELREATSYLVSVPESAAGYRHAALLCLLPAYQTILTAAQKHESLFGSAHQVKISRLTMARCVADSEAMLFDNLAIRRYSQHMEAKTQSHLGLSGTPCDCPNPSTRNQAGSS